MVAMAATLEAQPHWGKTIFARDTGAPLDSRRGSDVWRKKRRPIKFENNQRLEVTIGSAEDKRNGLKSQEVMAESQEMGLEKFPSSRPFVRSASCVRFLS
jgi:hypothetical protein